MHGGNTYIWHGRALLRPLLDEAIDSAGELKVSGLNNVEMQLRKVCNHPDMFMERPIESPFDSQQLVFRSHSRFLLPSRPAREHPLGSGRVSSSLLMPLLLVYPVPKPPAMELWTCICS